MLKLKLFFLVTLCCCLLLAAPARAQEVVSEGVDADEQAAAAGDLDLTSDQVQQIQTMLKDLGYFFGPADGRKGPRTRTALRNFQRDQGVEPTGSLDRDTVERIEDTARMTRTEATPVPEVAAAAPKQDGEGNFLTATGGFFKKTGGAVVTGTKVAGKATGTGVATAGKATGVAGKATGTGMATAGKATAKAGEATYDAGVVAAKSTAKASVVAAKAVAHAPVAVYNGGKRLLVGNGGDGSDEKIRKAIERQYAVDDRLTPGEVEVRVTKGNVTLAFPEEPRSDVAHAVRLARLTPGVKTVTSVYVSTQVAPQNDAPEQENSGSALTPEEMQATPPPNS